MRGPGMRWGVGLALVAAASAGGARFGAGRAAALEGGKKRATVEDMDIALLEQNLLKIYIIEKESGINDMRLEQNKVASQVLFDPTKETLRKPTEDQLKDIRKRHKTIWHYLMLEKTNALECVQIVDRVLGIEVHLPGEGRPERRILERSVALIDIPAGTDFEEAIKVIGNVLGCEVRADLPPLEKFTIRIFMERTTGEALIKQVCAQLPLDWKIEGKTLVFRHVDFFDAGKANELDEDEKKALEEEKKKNK